jgi:hypothetical protein
MILRRQRRALLVAAAIIVGGLLGWLFMGPPLVERWAMKELPGSNHYGDYEFARDGSMSVGAVLGAITAVVVVVVAQRLFGRNTRTNP